MEKKEYAFNGGVFNGFLMLFVICVLLVLSVTGIVLIADSAVSDMVRPIALALCVLVGLSALVMCNGFMLLEPNTARVMMFFGKYHGTFDKTGFFWVNPFYTSKSLSLRARNLDAAPIKVNDKTGNPIMIGMVLVWKVCDTYRTFFDIDSQSFGAGSVNMSYLQSFVNIQADAALREVTGHFAYDDPEARPDGLTLRDGSKEISSLLETKINERLQMAGIEVVEARLNYLAYAPEIAAVMLKRQQASAVIAAREKIVEGAVSMVQMALDRIEKDKIAQLDARQRAAMVSNLLVVLCSEEPAQPVLNTSEA